MGREGVHECTWKAGWQEKPVGRREIRAPAHRDIISIFVYTTSLQTFPLVTLYTRPGLILNLSAIAEPGTFLLLKSLISRTIASFSFPFLDGFC